MRKGEWVKGDASEYKSQWSCTTDSVHCTVVRKVWGMCTLLLWQWNGSSCFVLQQKGDIIRIWINKIRVTVLIILLFCFFSVLLKSMGGTIPPAPANASTEETSKVRYEEFITENWCWQNYWAAEGEKLLSVFTQMREWMWEFSLKPAHCML